MLLYNHLAFSSPPHITKIQPILTKRLGSSDRILVLLLALVVVLFSGLHASATHDCLVADSGRIKVVQLESQSRILVQYIPCRLQDT